MYDCVYDQQCLQKEQIIKIMCILILGKQVDTWHASLPNTFHGGDLMDLKIGLTMSMMIMEMKI